MLALLLIIAIVLTGVVTLVLLSGIALYNRLIRLRAKVSTTRRALEKKKENEAERQYEAAAHEYNIAIETFPANIIARWFGLEREDVQ